MQSGKSVLLIDIPPLIRLELKERFTDWYSRCIFDTAGSEVPGRAEVIVMPAEKLIGSNCDSRPIIAFGPADLLEASYLHGAADYLRNPWLCSELLIRCRPFLDEFSLHCEGSVISGSPGIIRINGRIVDLSPYQCRILMILLKNSNSFVGYTLLKEILGIRSDYAEKSLHVHIHNLRNILKRELPGIYGKSLYIKNSSSRGYALIHSCG